MPWQRMVADVAGEIDPDTGQLYYSEVDVTVPRQCGKTTLVLSVATDRGIVPWAGGRQRTIYAAQTRNDARKKLLDEQKVLLEGSGVGRFMLKARTANGSEQLRWRNGSTHGLMAVTKKSGHGPTIDVGFLDEFFAQVDHRLEQAVRPSMITRPSRQLWVVSTAGDASSFPLRSKVDRGRARSKSGQHGRIASFEWSAPDDADPNDPATWWATIPALGYTQSIAAIEGERDGLEGGMDEFMRAYLNMWRDGMSVAPVLPEWGSCKDEFAAIDGRAAFAIDVAPDSSWASIAAGGRTAEGYPTAQLIDYRPGTGWVVERVVELVRKWRPLSVGLDPRSSAAALLNDLVTAKVDPLFLPQTAQMAQACGALFNAATSQPTESGLLLAPTFRHRGQQQVDAALAGATKRVLPGGDGGAWLWDKRDASVDISPLVAITLASWLHDREALKSVDVLSSLW
jgi:hypothetical protein